MNPLFAFGMPTGGEWIVVLIIVVLLFGPSKLPGLARALGRSIGEFKRAKQEFENELTNAAKTDDDPNKPKTTTPGQLEPPKKL